jgi:hypothetical protein
VMFPSSKTGPDGSRSSKFQRVRNIDFKVGRRFTEGIWRKQIWYKLRPPFSAL